MIKHTYEYVKEQIESVKGYKLLSKEYINAHTKLKIKCSLGHEYEVTYNNFQQKQRCKKCINKKRKNKLTYSYVKQQIEKEGYKLLSKKYKDNGTKLKLQCNKGHKYKTVYGNFQQGKRCSICDYEKISSKGEKEVLKAIKKIFPNNKIIANDRTQIINPITKQFLELDIWIPELNKAIEYNSKYWHSNKYSQFKDNQKIEQCKEKNINLLVIQEENWINDKNKEIKKLKIFLK